MKYKRKIPLPKELEPLAGLLERLGRRHDQRQVFLDFLEMSACALSNSCDRSQFDVRERRYMTIIKRYEVLEDRLVFPTLLAEVAIALLKTEQDVLGPLTAAFGINDRSGQHGTPWTVSKATAQMVLADRPGSNECLADRINEHGFMTALEPACGPGGMILAFAQAFEEKGFNPKTQLHFRAVDIVPWCGHAAYIQISLMGLPAIVSIGDSLRYTFTDHWVTPGHVAGGFSRRLNKRELDEETAAWWRKASVSQRIQFLQDNELEVDQSLRDTASRSVLNAKETADIRKAEAAEDAVLKKTA